jgi:hypothetical protein
MDLYDLDDPALVRQAIAEVKQLSQRLVFGWETKNFLMNTLIRPTPRSRRRLRRTVYEYCYDVALITHRNIRHSLFYWLTL